MSRVLIIKTGAAGDVIRTTVLLHPFASDEVTWVTSDASAQLLPRRRPNLRTLLLEDAADHPDLGEFDLTISLDDERRCAELASAVRSRERVGPCIQGERIVYSERSQSWFDMGLVSRLGKARADELKKANRRTYQEILFGMLGREFHGEEYLIREDIRRASEQRLIGIESRAGKRWPTKVWNRYEALAKRLAGDGFRPFFFRQHPDVADYLREIARCSIVVTGDTLAMHVALALRIPTVALFTCTSPAEIYSYGLLEKIVSSRLDDAFYADRYIPEAVEAIGLEEVAVKVAGLYGRFYT